MKSGLQHPLEATKAGSHDEEKPASAKPPFLHNMVKLAVGHLVNDYEKWRNETGHRVRLWGPEADQVKEFGYDVEHALWHEMLCSITKQIVVDLFPGDHGS